tara:strand:- start:75 stop:1226 length:1152 start_codon:yes stop_codon:yes gene_type:complete
MCLADPSGNPRPYRAIHLFAQQGFVVDTLSFKPSNYLPIERSYSIPALSLAIHQRLYRFSLTCLQRLLVNLGPIGKQFSLVCNDARYNLIDIKSSLRGHSYDLFLVEDLQLVPLAIDVKGSAKILFDAREFYVSQNEESLRFKALEAPFRCFLLRKFAIRCDSAITVSDGLRAEYQKIYAIPMEVVRSSPPLQHMSIKPTAENFRLVHHGAANKNRGLHNMIEIVRRLDERYSLDFYLVGNSSYIDSLRKKTGGCQRIRFLPPVNFESIVSMLNDYDIGFFYCEPTTFNLKHCLPNKFFEFIQARLALAIGPSPEMAQLVSRYQCGFVSQEFSVDSMVQTLSGLTRTCVDNAKAQSDKAARDLCYENEASKLLSICKDLINFN